MSIKKSDVISLIGIGGELGASYLGRPGIPRTTGDHIVDRDNAAMHRDALAAHAQNRDRIRAMAGILERVAKLFVA